jgi:hypothetical protein
MSYLKSPAAFLAVAFVLAAGFAQAMLPGFIYAGRIAGSGIQAIAVVKAIEEVGQNAEQKTEQKTKEIGSESLMPVARPLLMAPRPGSKTYTSKQAVFVIEKQIRVKLDADDVSSARKHGMIAPEPSGKEVAKPKPAELSEGSEVTGIFHIPIVQTTDDPLFFSPEVGDRVFVTISSDGGEITSYTALDNSLENALLNDPESVKIGIGKVFLR